MTAVTPGREELLARWLEEEAAKYAGETVIYSAGHVGNILKTFATRVRLAAKPADEKLREALKPFARAFEALTEDDLATEGIDEMKISDLLYEPDYPTIGDLRKAHEALSGRLP